MAVERRLTELAGPGRRAAAHRALAQRPGGDRRRALHARGRAGRASRPSTALMAALVDAAERHLDWPLPGYTHLQRAQPVYLGHHLLAYVWMLERDRARLRFAAEQTAALPLGRGRAGRGQLRHRPRRRSPPSSASSGVAPNSIDAVSNRDFVLDYLGAAATCATHLSRLGAELVLWSSEEFGFVELPDAWSSGSSIMPQKKNPDAAELLRAKAPRIVGAPGRAARRDARAPADLQQGPAGGQGAPLRRRRHARAVPGRRDAAWSPARASAASAWPPPRPTSSSPRPTSPTCSSSAACRSARPTASSPGSCARRSSPGRLRPGRRLRACPALGRGRRGGARAQRSWLESKVSEGGTSLARVREQLERARALL